jgi:hypothetical protein
MHVIAIPLAGEWCNVQGGVRGTILVYQFFLLLSIEQCDCVSYMPCLPSVNGRRVLDDCAFAVDKGRACITGMRWSASSDTDLFEDCCVHCPWLLNYSSCSWMTGDIISCCASVLPFDAAIVLCLGCHLVVQCIKVR